MKKIQFILITFSLLFYACDKEEVIKKTRLKSYTFSRDGVNINYTIYYNSFNKIDSTTTYFGNNHYLTIRCIYKADKTIDSIGHRLYSHDRYDDIDVTYNNINKIASIPAMHKSYYYDANNKINQITIEGISNNYEYNDDSLLVYMQPIDEPDLMLYKNDKIAKSINNPFNIIGLENELPIIYELLGFSNVMYPFLSHAIASSYNEETGEEIIYNYEGSINGYPLKLTYEDITQTYTYEEF
ncbi:MAG: hypothetical protein IPK18_05845 [Sphingobacteriales bacterium]|jgi:hypothetical protein|nr:MAG: hypothetical protein IPK18_05845 [Sphingobacteriales bacterium]